LPLTDLHAVLDRAAAAHPHSPTLGDFRADRRLVADEARALDHAAVIVTPHALVAQRFGERAVHLSWASPATRVRARPPRRPGPPQLWLPASSVGRKGVHELRAALARLDRPLVLRISGRELEGPGFWRGAPGVQVVHGPPEALDDIDLAVLPAWVEHAPRPLLRAVAAGVPAIATRACGLAGVAGVIEIPTGDIEALHMAITAVLGARVHERAAE
jgi:hypothetical protein